MKGNKLITDNIKEFMLEILYLKMDEIHVFNGYLGDKVVRVISTKAKVQDDIKKIAYRMKIPTELKYDASHGVYEVICVFKQDEIYGLRKL